MSATYETPCPVCGDDRRSHARTGKRFCSPGCILWHVTANCPKDTPKEVIQMLWELPNTDAREGGYFPAPAKEAKAPAPAVETAKHVTPDNSLWNLRGAK